MKNQRCPPEVHLKEVDERGRCRICVRLAQQDRARSVYATLLPIHKYSGQYHCRDCWKEYVKRYQKRVYQNVLPVHDYVGRYHCKACMRETGRRYEQRVLAEIMSHYGSRCASCGATDIRVLSIDHIGGGGSEHRRSIGNGRITYWLRANGYPDGFQILCMNCQWIKRHENSELKR